MSMGFFRWQKNGGPLCRYARSMPGRRSVLRAAQAGSEHLLRAQPSSGMAFLNLTEIAGAGADVEPEYRNTPHAAFALLRERREKRPAPRGVLREMRGAGHAVNLAETETAQPCHGLRSTTLPNNCARAKQTETSGICPGRSFHDFFGRNKPEAQRKHPRCSG